MDVQFGEAPTALEISLAGLRREVEAWCLGLFAVTLFGVAFEAFACLAHSENADLGKGLFLPTAHVNQIKNNHTKVLKELA